MWGSTEELYDELVSCTKNKWEAVCGNDKWWVNMDVQENISMRKLCENCINEYLCDWTPAGQNDYCNDWVKEPDINLTRKDDEDEV